MKVWSTPFKLVSRSALDSLLIARHIVDALHLYSQRHPYRFQLEWLNQSSETIQDLSWKYLHRWMYWQLVEPVTKPAPTWFALAFHGDGCTRCDNYHSRPTASLFGLPWRCVWGYLALGLVWWSLDFAPWSSFYSCFTSANAELLSVGYLRVPQHWVRRSFELALDYYWIDRGCLALICLCLKDGKARGSRYLKKPMRSY